MELKINNISEVRAFESFLDKRENQLAKELRERVLDLTEEEFLNEYSFKVTYWDDTPRKILLTNTKYKRDKYPFKLVKKGRTLDVVFENLPDNGYEFSLIYDNVVLLTRYGKNGFRIW